MMKLGGRCVVRNLGGVRIWGSLPLAWVRTPKTCHFAKSRRMKQNVNKAMYADETSHWTQHMHKTCVQL